MAGGRPRKPKEVLELQGTARVDRINKDRVVLDIVTYVPPVPGGYAMNDFEKQNYFEVCELLMSVGLLTLADLSAIITYVKTLNIQREAFLELENRGVFVMQMDGSYKESRAVNVVATCTKALKDFWGRFGFTPADRERLSMGISKQPDKGEFD